MNNPWENIELSDYENHMRHDSVLQSQCLCEIMNDQFFQYDINSIMILGVAGGNGLQLFKDKKIPHIYAVDINDRWLHECQSRYRQLSDFITYICIDLCGNNISLPHSDMVVANLIIEYIGYKIFSKVIKNINPEYISCAIQVNKSENFVSQSPYLHTFDKLSTVYHKIDELGTITTLKQLNYNLIYKKAYELPNSKSLLQLDFKK